EVGRVGDAGQYGDLELSPDDNRLAVNLPDPTGRGRDLWIFDLARNVRTRFTFDPADESSSVWSPDGSTLVFGSERSGFVDLFQKGTNGTGADAIVFENRTNKFPQSWSRDGKFILYFTFAGGGGNDLFVLPL